MTVLCYAIDAGNRYQRRANQVYALEQRFNAWVDTHMAVTGWDVLQDYPALSDAAGQLPQFAAKDDCYEAMRGHFNNLNGASAIWEIATVFDVFAWWQKEREGL